MTKPDFLSRILGQTHEEYVQLPPEQRAAATRAVIRDLSFFFDEGSRFEDRPEPARTRAMALSLYQALKGAPEHSPSAKTLRERILTDSFVRSEMDRDQNVYLGRLFTRTLTNAVPDVVFQPLDLGEAQAALRWARASGVPLTLRGAGSAAMGGAVPNEGGLLLDLSRLDEVIVEERPGVVVIGAGARMRTVHAKLAARGHALPVYPSNPGGTFAGWFATGGIGLNAFGMGAALENVRAADVLLPAGEHVRFHDDGRLDVVDELHRRRTLQPRQAEAWFRERNYVPMTLSDLAGSEGAFGLIVQLTMNLVPRPEIGAFLLAFESRDRALDAVGWIVTGSGTRFPRPANVKFFSGSHMESTREVWADEDSREWKAEPSRLTDGPTLPWTRIAGPAELGAAAAAPGAAAPAGGFVFVDYLDLAAARAFAAALAGMPGAPAVLEGESERFAAERFKPQQTKRLGPGLLAAEILMRYEEVKAFLPKAERLAKNLGQHLDAEVYYHGNGTALVIAGYLCDPRRGGFTVDLALAPSLVDLAVEGHGGRPYVLGRWQSPWLERKFGREGAAARRAIKHALDRHEILSRGVLLGLRLRGALGPLANAAFTPAIATARAVYERPSLAWLARLARTIMRIFPGPAAGRGEPVRAGATRSQRAASRALNCVNCGESNTVCPIFHESKIRLPQMLTHLGERAFAGAAPPPAGAALLDLCMRCGNCEEVCQAGIPHLPMYEDMQRRSDAAHGHDHERHAAILGAVRGSPRYQREFLGVRPGGYQKRTPASLAGTTRYILLRAESESGPAETCIHCGACVPVCPTHANLEFEGSDARWITTNQERCIGCGTCVEICPANEQNGGRTLRVMEAPTAGWFEAIEAFEGSDRTAAQPTNTT
jgi:glycolate oxidase